MVVNKVVRSLLGERSGKGSSPLLALLHNTGSLQERGTDVYGYIFGPLFSSKMLRVSYGTDALF